MLLHHILVIGSVVLLYSTGITMSLHAQHRVAVFPGEHWTEVTPESQGVDAVQLNTAMKFLAEFIEGKEGVTRAAIIRNGYMIWKGSDLDTPTCTWSVTKAFASTVLGHLIDQGRCTLETRGAEYVSLLKPLYPDVTVRHFTTMTSGYDSEGPTWHKSATVTPLKPLAPQYAPGAMVNYSDHAMRMFGYVLTMIARENLDAYFRKHIARPIGMRDTQWEWRSDEQLVNVPGGHVRFDFANPDDADIRNAGGGLYMAASELARFGLLFLNRGNWDGTQVLSADWVDAATSVQVPATQPVFGDYGASFGAPGRQGYNWWRNGAGARGGTGRFPGWSSGAYASIGAQHNWCWVIPEWNMVIVRVGMHNPRYLGTGDKRYDMFYDMVAKAIVN